jgi:hypothetical protein
MVRKNHRKFPFYKYVIPKARKISQGQFLPINMSCLQHEKYLVRDKIFIAEIKPNELCPVGTLYL